MTTQAEEVHMALLLYEHPHTPKRDRSILARAVCAQARRLLREDYGLEGDWPADVQGDPGTFLQEGPVASPGDTRSTGPTPPGGCGKSEVKHRED